MSENVDLVPEAAAVAALSKLIVVPLIPITLVPVGILVDVSFIPHDNLVALEAVTSAEPFVVVMVGVTLENSCLVSAIVPR